MIEAQSANSWDVVRLGDLAKVKYGKARPKDEGEIPVVGSGGIYGYTAKPLVPYDTIVIGRKGSAGSIIFCPIHSYPSDTTFYLEWKREVDVPFLYSYLLFKSLAPDKSVIPSLQRSDVECFEVPFPPLAVQRAIARVMEAIQEAKEARQRELLLERERKAALMQYLFTKGTRGEAQKRTESGEIPRSWRVLKVGQIVEMKYGYQTSIPKTPPPDGVKIISTAEIMNDGRLNLAKVRTVEVPKHLVEGYCVTQNDILFNWRNSQEHVGKAAIVDFTPQEPTVYASFIIRLRTNAEAHYKYLHAHLTYLRNQGLFFKLSRRAVNQANFNANELAAINVSIPALDEQLEITNVLDACDNKISALEDESTRLNELFNAMLEELMTRRLSAIPLVKTELETLTTHT